MTGTAPGGRFPFPAAPTGWYRVAASADISGERIVPLRYFGRDLACGRLANGRVVVFTPFCPHLGAHLGHGGRVEGDTVVCPLDGWSFDEHGSNVAIPHAEQPVPGARLEMWPTDEVNGMVLVWYSPSPSAPTFRVPRLPEADDDRFVELHGPRISLCTHVQEVMENTVDAAHFRFVHKTNGFGTPAVVVDGPMLRSTAPVSFATPRGAVPGEIESELWGLGIDVVRPKGIVEAAVVFAVTPVDGEQVDAGYTFFVPAGPDGTPGRLVQGLMRDFAKQVEQDSVIWEHKRYREHPALAPSERAITTYRRWASQFHPTAPPPGSTATSPSTPSLL